MAGFRFGRDCAANLIEERRTGHLAVLLLTLALALAVGLAPTAVAQPVRPAVEQVPCWVPVPEGLAPEDLSCAYITIPLEHADPAAGTIRLATLVVRAQGDLRRPDPVMVLSGGPGQGGVDLFPAWFPAGIGPVPLLAERDLVFVDQRGTGRSQPSLDCIELDAIDPPIDEADDALVSEGFAACRARLGGTTRLAAFDTANDAADLDVVRQALGYQQVNLYGVSYGAKLGLQAMRGNPGWIRSAVLGSVIAPLRNFVIAAPVSFQGSLDRVYARCVADPGCTVAFGDLEATVDGVADRLAAAPAEVTYDSLVDGQSRTTTITADALANTLFQGLYRADVIAVAPLVIAAAGAGDYAPLARLRELVGQPGTFSEGLYLSTVCAEEVRYFSPRLARWRYSQQSDIVARHFVPGQLDLQQQCDDWDVEPASPLFRVPVRSTIPTLLVTGEFDPITPPSFGAAVHRALPDSQLVEVRGVGHSPLESVPPACSGPLVSAFVAAPGTPVDAACTQVPVDFLTPEDVPAGGAEGMDPRAQGHSPGLLGIGRR